ncbi:MAG: hypothetical protein PVJ39_05035 [Gammaproteobacteria bacterium]|jgi:hypothetical protein
MVPKKRKTEKQKRDKPKKTGKSKDEKKVIRDSFTMPENDYRLLKALKQRCLDLGIHVKKSELLRTGLHALNNMDDNQLAEMTNGIEKIKTGRPAKSEQTDTTTGDTDQ